ncbi:unnamed protein product, partial [Meganyctiphanes norvegica]
VEWNETLISSVLPSAYTALLLEMKAQYPNKVTAQTLYNLLPRLSTTTGRWHKVAVNVWNNLKLFPIFYSQVAEKLLQFHEIVVTNSLNSPGMEDSLTVIQTLTDLGTPLATLPLHVWDSLQK